MQHFSLMGSIDPAPLQSAVTAHARYFGEVNWRETFAGTPHPDTQTLYLRMPPVLNPETLFESMEVVDLPLMTVPNFANAVIAVGRMTGRPVARAMVVKLNPGGKIGAHIDQGSYAEATERWHVPVSTNDKAWLQSDDERVWMMEPGHVWWFDKHSLHLGGNEGATPRIHMIVDTWR